MSKDMQGADMRDADMRDADMRNAYMRGAFMRNADMQGAYMRGAYMRNAYMRNADMRDADMQGADMRDAFMRYADMSNTTCQLILRDDGRGYGVHVDHHENGSIMFRAGCRTFTLKEARAHWSDPNHEHPECARRILNAIEWYNEGRERGLLWELT